MSIFNELLPKIHEISKAFTQNINDDLKAAFECFDKFEEEFQNAKGKAREKAQKEKNPMTTLQSIHEDEDDTHKQDTVNTKGHSSNEVVNGRSSTESNGENPHRASKKRSKHEVDGLFSPEQDKRQKRNASVKAQSIISKQVNVNLTQKLRREDPGKTQSTRSRKGKEHDKENAEPVPNIQIKQEKESLPSEPMEMESHNIEVKQEMDKDHIAMPPPGVPVPKPRKAVPKEKHAETSEEESSGIQRSTRARKQADTVAPPVASSRSTRASSRSARQTADSEAQSEEPPAPRPKRTRAKKKVSESSNTETEKETTPTSDTVLASPAEKPRPKRTRRAQKSAEKFEDAPPPPPPLPAPEPIISPKVEPILQSDVSSPILQKEMSKKPAVKIQNNLKNDKIKAKIEDHIDAPKDITLDETRVLGQNVDNAMDKTMVLPNGVYNHAPVTPTNVRNMNETVVLETCNRETMLVEKQPAHIMDATVVLDKDPKPTNITDDNSLLTDDSDTPEILTPPKQDIPIIQPSSAVKAKVQQFEELASRVTRTKTRAMAKKEEQTETHTPPDKIVKQVISVDTLNKMNNMIFNGKQISSSATKPRTNLPPTKSTMPASTSKLSGINRAREAAEDSLKKEKEDARKKKEAMLEAKRELHKRKREDKMAAAAAAREAAERERRVAMEAAAKERMEKQAHADQGKLERLKEAERKKLELARKVAETEERRRADEQARQQRLADDQRRADAARRKQLEEAEAMKKEAVVMAKEIEKRQKEYIEKQKMKQKLESKSHTPLKAGGAAASVEPVYMADGFQYLTTDDDSEPEKSRPPERPTPLWSTSKVRKQRLAVQSHISQVHIDRLFSVRVHSPDLRDLFPNIERGRLKRTSSAVWRTPPGAARLPALQE